MPAGDIEQKVRKTKTREEYDINQLKFELSQKNEALKFKEKALKQANTELVDVRSHVIDLKNEINFNQEKTLSTQIQQRAKDDKIKLLERKVDNLINTKSIGVRLEVDDLNELKCALADIRNNNLIMSVRSTSSKHKNVPRVLETKKIDINQSNIVISKNKSAKSCVSRLENTHANDQCKFTLQNFDQCITVESSIFIRLESSKDMEKFIS